MSGNGTIRARAYTWNRGQDDEKQGILLRDRRGQLIAHLSYTEARRLADTLHDACDTSDGELTKEAEK